MDIAECVKVWNRLIDTLGDHCLMEEAVPVTQGLQQFIFISIIVISVLPPVNIFVVLDLNGSDQSRELKLFVKNFLCSDYKAKITCCNHFLCVGSVEMHCTCKVVFFFLIVLICFLLDLNVEHLQLLLFIFHNFPVTQRKRLLTYCARVIITVANSASVLHSTPMALNHLLLLLDYFLHHLSTPPEELFKQVCG